MSDHPNEQQENIAAKSFRWATIWGLSIAAVAGLVAFTFVILEITVPIPGLNVITDPREVVVILGAAISGPIGAILVGVLAGAAVPGGNALASIISHSLAGVCISLAYRHLTRLLHRSTFRFSVLWTISVAAYFYAILMPIFILTHNLYHPEPYDFWPVYATIARGALWEAVGTMFITTAVMVVSPRRYRRPLWG
ncbi:MAG: hypothetical protein JW987_03185 [Anaerolineaceae bacterium]|nr:hypothetical protein [Anaerolineaceae bacterium]